MRWFMQISFFSVHSILNLCRLHYLNPKIFSHYLNVEIFSFVFPFSIIKVVFFYFFFRYWRYYFFSPLFIAITYWCFYLNLLNGLIFSETINEDSFYILSNFAYRFAVEHIENLIGENYTTTVHQYLLFWYTQKSFARFPSRLALILLLSFLSVYSRPLIRFCNSNTFDFLQVLVTLHGLIWYFKKGFSHYINTIIIFFEFLLTYLHLLIPLIFIYQCNSYFCLFW